MYSYEPTLYVYMMNVNFELEPCTGKLEYLYVVWDSTHDGCDLCACHCVTGAPRRSGPVAGR